MKIDLNKYLTLDELKQRDENKELWKNILNEKNLIEKTNKITIMMIFIL